MTAGAMDMTGTGERAVSAAHGAHGTGSAPLRPATVQALEAVGLDVADVVRVVRATLDEDFRYGADVTSAATVAGRTVTADVVAREAGVVAGLPVALAVFDLLADYLGGQAGARKAGAANDASAAEASGAASEMMRDTSGPYGGTLYPASSADGLPGPRRAETATDTTSTVRGESQATLWLLSPMPSRHG